MSDIIVSLAKVSAKGVDGDTISGGIGALLPRLASTGQIAKGDPTKALAQIKQFTSELESVADAVPADDLLQFLKSLDQYAGDLHKRFVWMRGLLYEVSAANRYVGQGTMRLQVRVSDSTTASIDTIVGRTFVEAKHGVADTEAKVRFVKQLKAAYASGKGDNMVVVVPDASVRVSIKDYLYAKTHGGQEVDRVLAEILASDFLFYKLVPSIWK